MRLFRGFRVVHVFDPSQCDGPPLPDVRPATLTGDAPGPLWHSLAAQVEAAGFTLERGGCAGANGRTDYATRTVRVRDDVDAAQAAKTLAHDHVLLHDGGEYNTGCRGRAEVEAESVAFLVLSSVGLDAGAYSFAYVASWSDGVPERVIETAAVSLPVPGRSSRGLSLSSRTPSPDPAPAVPATCPPNKQPAQTALPVRMRRERWAGGDIARVCTTAERVVATAQAVLAALAPQEACSQAVGP